METLIPANTAFLLPPLSLSSPLSSSSSVSLFPLENIAISKHKDACPSRVYMLASGSGSGSGDRTGGRANDTPRRRSVAITNKTNKSNASGGIKNGNPSVKTTPKPKPKRRVVKVFDPDSIQDEDDGIMIDGDDGIDNAQVNYLFDDDQVSPPKLYGSSKPSQPSQPSQESLPQPPRTAVKSKLKPQSKSKSQAQVQRQTQSDDDDDNYNDTRNEESLKSLKQTKQETILWDPKKHPRNTTEFLGSYSHPPTITTKPSSNDTVPEVAFVGRSNIGKSSMVNMITGRKKLAIVSKTPGRTQFINLFMIKDQRDKVYAVADLPGYGFAKMSKEQQKDIAKFISEYLANRQALKLTILLVDIRNKPAEQDLRFMDVLSDLDLPFLVVATKCDRMKANEREQCLKEYSQLAGLETAQIISSSSETGEGKQAVLSAMMDAMFGSTGEGSGEDGLDDLDDLNDLNDSL